MTRLSLARHDPFEGSGARRSRYQRKVIRWAVALVTILAIGVVVTHLPPIDPSILTTPSGKPILAGAILSLLGAVVLLGLARMRRTGRD